MREHVCLHSLADTPQVFRAAEVMFGPVESLRNDGRFSGGRAVSAYTKESEIIAGRIPCAQTPAVFRQLHTGFPVVALARKHT